MRGYTTLLSHILGSHPEISGYSETWVARGKTQYRGGMDLLKLRCVVCYHGNYKKNSTYVLDKLLHNEIQLSDAILARGDIRYVVMLREPKATLESMLALHRRYASEGSPKGNSAIPATAEDALSYYASRLSELASIGERLHRLGKSACLIRAEDLTRDPRSTLTSLEAFLDLKTPLNEQYSVFARTGAWDLGDVSDFIRKGKIESVRPSHTEILIPDHLLEEANREYTRCLSVLLNQFSAAAPAPLRQS